MQTIIWNHLSETEKRKVIMRPVQQNGENIQQAVNAIRENVAYNGDRALFELCEKFDGVKLDKLIVSADEIQAASSRISVKLRNAIEQAKTNIEAFHKAQQNQEIDLEIQEARALPSCDSSNFLCRALYSRWFSTAVFHRIDVSYSC